MNADQEMKLCQIVETGLCNEYAAVPELTDALCIIGLDNAVIALKQHAGYAKNESVRRHPAFDSLVNGVVGIGIEAMRTIEDVTLKDYIAVIQKIKKSVIRHAIHGPRAYYTFVRAYV